MRNSQKINRLAQKLIDLSKVEGIVDESSLWKGLQGVKASKPKHWIPLLKILKHKLSRVLAWQTAEVTSSTALEASTVESLKESFSKRYDRPIDVKTKIDPSLIAGIRVKIGDDVFDASIAERLKRISEINKI
jgi:F-type H+-transporting ATPase subunit delta